MKKRLTINMVLFDIVPIVFYICLFFLLFIGYKVWIAILLLIPFIEHIVVLIKNLKFFKFVQNKIDNLGKTIYDDGYTVLSNTTMISTKNYFFSVDYEDIECVYTRKRMFINCWSNSLCIITKNGKKYELVFINWINSFSSKNKQMKEIIRIIKSHNFDVKTM